MPATAFVLAAGLGTRLRPLTLTTPKPLLPVGGRPLLDHVVEQLRRHGHEEILVNAHWLSDQIVAWGEGKPGITVVVETPAILGTGGGLVNAASRLADRFVVVNGDILSDIDLGALWQVDAPAVMALRSQEVDPRSPSGRPPVHTPVFVEAGTVTGIRGVVGASDGPVRVERHGGLPLSNLHFTGVHVLDRAVLAHVPPGEQCIIRTAYRALIPTAVVRGVVHPGRWTDIGTLDEYAAVADGIA